MSFESTFGETRSERPGRLESINAAVTVAVLEEELDVAEQKALKALAGYKFQMFGYWAAIWVHLNRIGDFKRPSPFRKLVHAARAEIGA